MNSSSTVIDSLSIVGNWCSIIGLAISIGTIIFSFIINRKVQELKTKILFNTRIDEHINTLKQINSSYYSMIDNIENHIAIKSKLKEFETTVQIILKIVPKDFKSDGNRIINTVSYQYRTIGQKNLSKLCFWKNEITKDDLWQTYDLIVAFIDKIDSFNKDKMINR